MEYSQVQSIFLETLNNIAPVKIKILRYNNNPFMNKDNNNKIKTKKQI